MANEDLLTEDALVSEICQANNIVSYSYVLEVNGRAVGVGANDDEIKDALRARLTQYSNENTISAEFTAPVSVTREIISDAQGRSLSTVDEAVNATSQEEVIYTIQAGDTWSEIAARYDMSSSDLLALNPGFDMDKIWRARNMTVSAAVPLLSVKTVDRVSLPGRRALQHRMGGRQLHVPGRKPDHHRRRGRRWPM